MTKSEYKKQLKQAIELYDDMYLLGIPPFSVAFSVIKIFNNKQRVLNGEFK